MRRIFLLQPIVWAMMCMLFSCQKEERSVDRKPSELISKINLWLDAQKITSNITKENNIQSLKTNLELSKVRFEKLGQNEQFLVVPISDEYKKTGRFDKNSIINLLLVIDELGNIKRGNISEFIPESSLRIDRLPSNTFYSLYNNYDLEFDGKFRFLSVTGRWLHQFGVKNGKLSSMGIMKPKPNSSSNVTSGRTNTCIAWYWVTTYYNSDGEVIDETWEYIGMTCTNEECADPNNAMLCPDATGGSGGGGGEEDVEETCCIPDPNFQMTVANGNETQWYCAPEGIDAVSGNPTKTCTHKWTFQHNHLLWYSWDFIGTTFANFEKMAGEWKFRENPSFKGVTTSGQLPPCVSSKCSAVFPNISLAPNKGSATLLLSYTIETKVTCFLWAQPRYDDDTLETTLIPPA